jgi:hypothetical protein
MQLHINLLATEARRQVFLLSVSFATSPHFTHSSASSPSAVRAAARIQCGQQVPQPIAPLTLMPANGDADAPKRILFSRPMCQMLPRHAIVGKK